jgi:hypothetical protein
MDNENVPTPTPAPANPSFLPEEQLKILNQVMNEVLGNMNKVMPKVADAQQGMTEFLQSMMPQASQTESESESEIDFDLQTVFVVYENDESIGFFYLWPDAVQFVRKRYHEFMWANSHRFLSTVRANDESYAYDVFEKTPYLWFLYSQSCVYSLRIERVDEIEADPNEDDMEIDEEEADDEDEDEDEDEDDEEEEEEHVAEAPSPESAEPTNLSEVKPY